MIQFTFLPDTRWLVLFAGRAGRHASSFVWRAQGRAGTAGPHGADDRSIGNPGPRCRLSVWIQNRVDRIEHRPKSRMAVLVDTSRSMGTQDVPGGTPGRWTGLIQRNLFASKPAGKTQVETFVSTRGSLRHRTFVPWGDGFGDDFRRPGGAAQVPATDPWTSVVLVSDGIDTTLQPPESVARQYRRRGIPIRTVTTGTTNDVRDIVVDSVQVRRGSQ